MLIGIFISIILIILSFQDIKYRHINGWFLIPLLFLMIIQPLQAQNKQVFLIGFGLNVAFLLMQFILVGVYYYFKERQFNIVNTKLGIGDVLLFLIICAGFSFRYFIIFYVETLIISILVTLIIVRFNRYYKKSIPLVAYISVNYIIWYWLSIILHKNLLYL